MKPNDPPNEPHSESQWPSPILKMACLYFALAFVLHLAGGIVDQPHPRYEHGHWLTFRMQDSVWLGIGLAMGIAIIVATDQAIQRSRGVTLIDNSYFPTLAGLRRCLSVPSARRVLVIGFLLLSAYFIQSELELQAARALTGGWVWPPERIVVLGIWAWGLVWFADCLARPEGGTVAAAVGFAVLTLFISPGHILRE